MGSVLGPSDSYFLFADLVGFYTHWTCMHIFRHIFLSNYWWQRSDTWSQASYRYPISWEAFFDPSDSYFLFAEEWGYHKWALAHSSSCLLLKLFFVCMFMPWLVFIVQTVYLIASCNTWSMCLQCIKYCIEFCLGWSSTYIDRKQSITDNKTSIFNSK